MANFQIDKPPATIRFITLKSNMMPCSNCGIITLIATGWGVKAVCCHECNTEMDYKYIMEESGKVEYTLEKPVVNFRFPHIDRGVASSEAL